MKKLLVLILSTNLIISGLPANAAVKAGQFCKKSLRNKTVLLSDNTKLICILNGKKYRWMQLVSEKQKSPSQTGKSFKFGEEGGTQFARFKILKEFTLDSVGLEEKLGQGKVFLIKECLQETQQENPVGNKLSFAMWSAIDETGNRIQASTIKGPPELDPTFPTGNDPNLRLKPGECLTGHIVIRGSAKLVELQYVDKIFSEVLRFAVE